MERRAAATSKIVSAGIERKGVFAWRGSGLTLPLAGVFQCDSDPVLING